MNTRPLTIAALLCIVATAAEAAPPYRERIPAEKTQAIRARRLGKRDQPLPVGAAAPRFAGLPQGKPVVLVFYRGHW